MEAASGTDVHAPPPPSDDAQPPLAGSQPVGMESDTPADDKPGPPEASGSRKRARDEDEDEDGEGQRDQRVVRQRSDSYKPARGEALWNLLTKPFRSFVEGFQQGLNMKPTPPS